MVDERCLTQEESGGLIPLPVPPVQDEALEGPCTTTRKVKKELDDKVALMRQKVRASFGQTPKILTTVPEFAGECVGRGRW